MMRFIIAILQNLLLFENISRAHLCYAMLIDSAVYTEYKASNIACGSEDDEKKNSRAFAYYTHTYTHTPQNKETHLCANESKFCIYAFEMFKWITYTHIYVCMLCGGGIHSGDVKKKNKKFKMINYVI